MHKIFIENGAEFEPPEVPISEGLQVTLEFYDNGFEMTLVDNYEGPPRFDIDPQTAKMTHWVIAQLVSKGYVYYPHQILRVRAVKMRMQSPRYQHGMKRFKAKGDGSQDHQVSVAEGERDVSEMTEPEGELDGQDAEGEGGQVREGDPEPPVQDSEPDDPESGGIGL